jgi:hypothetical protein
VRISSVETISFEKQNAKQAEDVRNVKKRASTRSESVETINEMDGRSSGLTIEAY